MKCKPLKLSQEREMETYFSFFGGGKRTYPEGKKA